MTRVKKHAAGHAWTKPRDGWALRQWQAKHPAENEAVEARHAAESRSLTAGRKIPVAGKSRYLGSCEGEASAQTAGSHETGQHSGKP